MQITPLLSGVAKTGTETNQNNIAGDFDKFLRLLTTQLQNQDPMSPLDANEFTAQLVQFSEVEQSVAMNKHLTNLIAMQEGTQAQNALSYVGRDIDALGSSFPLSNGKAELFYNVDGKAKSVALQVVDQNGNVVRTIPGTTLTGQQRISWDGKDAAGKQLKDGTYKLQVVARDADNKALPTQGGFTGRVDQVTNVDGALTLYVGKIKVPMSEIVAVRVSDTKTP